MPPLYGRDVVDATEAGLGSGSMAFRVQALDTAGGCKARLAAELWPVPDRPSEDVGAESETWLHILPAGPELKARDGRRFSMAALEDVVAASELPLLVDIDHRADMGLETSASGWVEELKVVPADEPGQRAGIWGRVEYTAKGRELAQSREYRFTSAVATLADDKQTITALEGVSLTNKPALSMQEIAAFSESYRRVGPAEETEMNKTQLTALCSALGLPEDSAPDAVIAAAENRGGNDTAKELGVLRSSNATLSREVATFRDRAEAAEAKLTEMESAAFSAEVDRYLDDASRDGKVLPAERDALRELAMAGKESFSRVQSLVDSRPEFGSAAPASRSEGGKASLSVDKAVQDRLRRLGWTDERIKETAAFRAENESRIRATED